LGVTASTSSSQPVILRAKGIRKSYHLGEEDLVILKQADLTIRRGEFVAIEGRSGSGKSTLLHILGGLDSATEGTLEFEDVAYKSRPSALLEAPGIRWLRTFSPLTRMLVYLAGIVAAIGMLIVIAAINPPNIDNATASITLLPRRDVDNQFQFLVLDIDPRGPIATTYPLKVGDEILDIGNRPRTMGEMNDSLAARILLWDKTHDGRPLKVVRAGREIGLARKPILEQLSIRLRPWFSGITFVAMISVLIIAITLYLRWEGRLLLFLIFWICADLALTMYVQPYSWRAVLAVVGIVVALFCILAVLNTYLAERPICRLRNKEFGFVFQFYHLLPELNVLENTLVSPLVETSWFGYAVSKEQRMFRAKSLLEQLGLGHRLRHKPNQLSGGERQRVAIARALMSYPKILFADEPTGNLDYETGRQIMAVLEKLHRENSQTIVMVTHDRSLARQADRVLVLRDGKLERPGETSGADKSEKADYH
jgi:ABC-type lipoprotein export system ATPase subunit